jgi:acyl-CoA synthetase (AMP-forming)/AMP-acid ligase II
MDPKSYLQAAARRRASGDAVHCGGHAMGYPELRDLSGTLGEALTRSGARPGDRVAALFANCHLYLALYFAALERELILVPLNLRLSTEEIRAVLRHGGARLLAGDPERAGVLAPRGAAVSGAGWCVAPLDDGDTAPAGEAPGDAAHLYYTSGTTGLPKGVILTRGTLAAHVGMTLEELRFSGHDVWLHAAPMFHLADAWAIWTVTAAAATHVLLPRFDASEAFDLIERHGVTITNLVPTMLLALLAEAERRRRPLRSLRLLLSGGAPIAPSAVERVVRVLGCEYAQTYGLTETSPFLTFSLLDPEQRRLPAAEQLRLRARTGRPAKGVTLRVVRAAGNGALEDVPPDDRTVGEVIARGATVSPGYWRDPQATAEAFRDGWFHTGDLGTLDGHGFLNLVDRIKDVILTGGETVYSTEVENLLYEHPGVGEAAVFGVPDESWGEAVRAAVVPKAAGAATPSELVAFCRERIAHYKCPRVIDLVESLPRTGSGKTDKKALREPFWRGRPRRIN